MDVILDPKSIRCKVLLENGIAVENCDPNKTKRTLIPQTPLGATKGEPWPHGLSGKNESNPPNPP